MKYLLGLLTLTFAMNVMANDGGMSYINVQGIAPTNAKEGTEIKFYGKDAANFMRLLPGYSSVLYSMVSPQVADKLQDSERGVMVASKGWTLVFGCTAGELTNLDFDSDDEFGGYPNAVFAPRQPECTVSLYKGNWTDEGDNWSMKPLDYRKTYPQPY